MVILPIYRNDDERSEVMPYCATLERELTAQSYAGEPIRVRIDNRDIRGGDKKWQWVKRGVPIRVEIGPRDVAGGKISFGRRDVAGKFEAAAGRVRRTIARKCSTRFSTGCLHRATTIATKQRPCESTA